MVDQHCWYNAGDPNRTRGAELAQAKGVLPRSEDRDVLYRNPRMCGYFVAVKLDPAMDRSGVETWLAGVDRLVAQLVARLPRVDGVPGDKIASVAIGLSPTFFRLDGQPRFAHPEPPASFSSGVPLPNESPLLSAVPAVDADLLFYVASTCEARVNAFVTQLAEMRPDVQRLSLDRGYQRVDDSEPFGYRDGLRNIPRSERSTFVFVHTRGRECDEPSWADGGTYMVFMKILQRPERFAALADDDARDRVIGRTKAGIRLDLVAEGTPPHQEPPLPEPDLPPTSHVRKAGPRGARDDIQIFRRGLPFLETTPDGQLRVGLNFCSFQASLDQFDVVLNDWMLNPSFPPQGGGATPDALLDPGQALTQVEKLGFYFVPPHNEKGLVRAIFPEGGTGRRPTTGQLVVRKRVIDPSDAARRFERRGFRFDVIDEAQGRVVVGSEFVTDSTGRGLCPVGLVNGRSYLLRELFSPVDNILLGETRFTMERRSQLLCITNEVTQPNTPYATR
jgi:Dyp-type peroxidase family